jgi:hypothetical protein
MIFLDHCIPTVEAELMRSNPRTRLLVHAGLLARYNRIPLLTRLSQRVSQSDGPHGLWLLLPADGQFPLPMIEGKAVPVITTNDCLSGFSQNRLTRRRTAMIAIMCGCGCP